MINIKGRRFLFKGIKLAKKMCKWDQCKLEKLKLNHDNPVDFMRPLTGRRHVLYVIYRWLFALYFLAINIYDLSYRFPYPIGKWFKDLTHWSFVTVTLSSVVQAVISTDYYLNPPPASQKGRCTNYVEMDWKSKLAWVLNNLSIVQAPMVAAIYWLIVYDPDVHVLQIVNITTHGVNVLYVIIEFSISAIPVRLLHMYMILVFGAIYGMFTVIYWKAGGTNNQGKPYIYSVLDYSNDLKKAIIWLVLMHGGILVVHCIWFGLYRLKLIIYKKRGWIHRVQISEKSASFHEIPME